MISLFLIEALCLHQDAFGAVDQFSFFQLRFGFLQFLFQRLLFSEARDGDIDDRFDAFGVEAVDNVGADAGLDDLIDGVTVLILGKQNDRQRVRLVDVQDGVQNRRCRGIDVQYHDIGQ